MVLQFQFICIFVVYSYLFQNVLSDECSCIDLRLEDVKTCKDWEAAPVKVDVEVNMDDEYGSLNGKIIAGASIVEGVEISLVILLQTPNGDELVYSATADVCQNLGDKNTMWYPVIEIFNTTSCPIPKGNFAVNDVKINLSSIKEIFNKDFIGYYSIIVTVEFAVNKYMCFVLGAEIIEEKRPCNECPFS